MNLIRLQTLLTEYLMKLAILSICSIWMMFLMITTSLQRMLLLLLPCMENSLKRHNILSVNILRKLNTLTENTLRERLPLKNTMRKCKISMISNGNLLMLTMRLRKLSSNSVRKVLKRKLML